METIEIKAIVTISIIILFYWTYKNVLIILKGIKDARNDNVQYSCNKRPDNLD